MKGSRFVLAGGPVLLLLSACLLFDTRGARDVYVVPGQEAAIREAAWEVGSVRVAKAIGAGSLEEEAQSILRIVLARERSGAGRAGNPTESPRDAEAGRLTLNAVIRERTFMRDYRSLNALSVELSLYGPDGTTPIAVALYSENSRETIESHPYLYALLRRALRLFG